jgi:FlaG/FlaF family flagellin (archaellin)
VRNAVDQLEESGFDWSIYDNDGDGYTNTGDEVTFTIDITNTGTQTITGLDIQDTLSVKELVSNIKNEFKESLAEQAKLLDKYL